MSRLVSRLALVCTLVVSLSPLAHARRLPPPPVTAGMVAPAPEPALDRAALRERLAANRAANLVRFRDYQQAGVFPSNVYYRGKLNVWRDQAGHFCAAATIIRASGQVALVDEVAEENNFIRLADVDEGPLMDWILTSGLTHAEIVLIQKPFRPVTVRPEHTPRRPVVVDATMRAYETRRLAAAYRAIDARLVRDEQANLDAAVDELMKHPSLASQLLATR
jgi:hypothetical protein